MIKVSIADNQEVFRAGLARILALRDDIHIVSQTSDADQLIQCMYKFRKSIVVFASTLRSDLPCVIRAANTCGCKLIVVAENTEHLRFYAKQTIEGVIFRDISSAGVVSCVYTVASGESYLQQKSGRSLTDESDVVGDRVLRLLTPKEIKIVCLIAQGYTNREIAGVFATSEQVVKNCLRHVYDKIGVSNRLELALFTTHHHALAAAAAHAWRLMCESEFCRSNTGTGGA